MRSRSQPQAFDTIVIGSGIGGLTAAAALAKCGRRVLVLEQHLQLGGLTQAFERDGYAFAAGVHYIGGLGEVPGRDGQLGRLMRWVSDGRLRFASIGSPYEILRLPDLEIAIEAPRSALVAGLKGRFPHESAAIDAYFKASEEARSALLRLFASKAMPNPVGGLMRALGGDRLRRVVGTTTAEALAGIRDRRLAAVLGARWGDYGVPPDRSPFAVHALVTESQAAGAYYPVGGPGLFAEALAPTVAAAGGQLRTRAPVAEIRVTSGKVAGVRLAGGEPIDASAVVSAMGAHNTAAALPAGVAGAWCEAVSALRAGFSYVCLYLGFRGDIRAHGATPASLRIYERDDIGALWEHPLEEEAPSMLVSFHSLKDPAHRDANRHTAEVILPCPWEPFAAWSGSAPGSRPPEYRAAKARIARVVRAQFERHFPRLAPLIAFEELSTPLSQAAFVRADRGAMYGLEMTAERLLDPSVGVRTPVPGLLLAGQDAISPGIQGAFMGGFSAAAVLEPRLWPRLLS